MTDCMPTTSGRSELSEKEKQVLGGFWVYVQPMSLYRQIQRHQEYQVAAGSTSGSSVNSNKTNSLT